jgi:hypothetical protein
MQTRIITGMIPPDGWHYLQEGKFRVDASSYDELIVAVINWRLQNQRGVGDAKGDIDQFICSNFPRQCQGVGPKGQINVRATVAQKALTAGARFVDRIIQWAVDAMNEGHGKDLEPAQEAARRAAICVECPRNSTWENSCPSCVTHAQRLMTIIRQGKDIPSLAPRLHACSDTNMDNRTSIWIKRHLLRKSPNMPKACWIP